MTLESMNFDLQVMGRRHLSLRSITSEFSFTRCSRERAVPVELVVTLRRNRRLEMVPEWVLG
jgi:hypothetical protein